MEKIPQTTPKLQQTWEKNVRLYIDSDGTDSVKLIHYLNRGKLNTNKGRQTVMGIKRSG